MNLIPAQVAPPGQGYSSFYFVLVIIILLFITPAFSFAYSFVSLKRKQGKSLLETSKWHFAFLIVSTVATYLGLCAVLRAFDYDYDLSIFALALGFLAPVVLSYLVWKSFRELSNGTCKLNNVCSIALCVAASLYLVAYAIILRDVTKEYVLHPASFPVVASFFIALINICCYLMGEIKCGRLQLSNKGGAFKKKEDTKTCPYCGETILAVAKKCKHCGEWLPEKEEVKPVVMVDCPICGEDVEEGTTICPHCKEPINL